MSVRFPSRRADGTFSVRAHFTVSDPSLVLLVRDYVSCWMRSNRVWVRIWRSDRIEEERLEYGSEFASDPVVEWDEKSTNGSFSILFECPASATMWKDWTVRLVRDVEVVFPEVKCIGFE